MQTELDPRHSLILTYRYLLRASYTYDVTSLSLPLFLLPSTRIEGVSPLNDEKLIRRAETMMKSTKGVMIEASRSYDGGNVGRSLTFFLTKNTSNRMWNDVKDKVMDVFRSTLVNFRSLG